MQVFYAPDIDGEIYSLGGKESKHAVRVLRIRKGMNVKLVDGRGNLYEGIVIEPEPTACKIRIGSVTRNFETRSYKLHIAISPLKNPDRFEWFVEKSVELGIDEITPLICKNTEKPGIKAERINAVIISAMKQSLKARLTVLNPVCSFSEFITRHFEGVGMIASCGNNVKRGVGEVCRKDTDVVFLIGPEGDFTPREVEEAAGKGFIPVHLGPSRLRTETAGVAACHSVYFINQ